MSAYIQHFQVSYSFICLTYYSCEFNIRDNFNLNWRKICFILNFVFVNVNLVLIRPLLWNVHNTEYFKYVGKTPDKHDWERSIDIRLIEYSRSDDLIIREHCGVNIPKK